jgi:hypothetical protein
MAANTEPEDKPSSVIEIRAPYYEAEFDDRIRIIIKYQNTWRPIFWFQIKKDGSVYAGPRYEEITYLAKGVKQVLEEKGDIRIKYNDGVKITNPDIL